MTGAARLRSIEALKLPDVEPNEIGTATPRFVEADPCSLLVDETYQRNLSERSIRLIRRIVAEWSWSAFKPPVVVETANGLHVVDGQHTAIGAAPHPAIERIPVMIVAAESREDRADAFVRHNRDRIQVTPNQLHYALVAAGNEDALTIEQVCQRAGGRVLRHPPGQGRFAVGDTMAVDAIRSAVNRRGAKGAREILQVCVEAKMAPVSAAALKAVEMLLFGQDYATHVDAASLALTIREMGADADRQAALFAAEHKVPIWRGLVVTLFRNTRKVRRGQREAA